MADFSMQPVPIQKMLAAEELRRCNDVTARFGLRLCEDEIGELVERRFEALRNTGRVEFGEGVLPKLIVSFCDSPFLTPQNYGEVLFELQDSFYYFKGEAQEKISDNELIDFMRVMFDGPAQGSVDYLSGTSLEDLCRETRYGRPVGEGQGDPLGWGA